MMALISYGPLQRLGAAEADATASSESGVALLTPVIADVALGPDGELTGRAINEQGQPWADAQVELLNDNKVVAKPVTDERGQFRVLRLRGGVYQLRSRNSLTHFRAWTVGTAPPSAEVGVTLSQGVVRGQGCTTPGCTTAGCGGRCGQGSALGLLMHPLVITAGVAAAIAIPLALDDDDDAASN
jgi:hypothetical protein